MHPARPAIGCEQIALSEVVHDFVQPKFHAVFVAADELEHVLRHGHGGIARIALEGGVRGVELDDQVIAQHDRHFGSAVDLECAELERLGSVEHRLRRERACKKPQDDGYCESHDFPLEHAGDG